MKNSTALALLLLSVGLFYTFISPHYDKVMALRDQSNKYKEILANVIELGKKRDTLTARYNNLPENEIARLEKVLPGNVDTVNLAMNFDSIAAKYGISIKTIRTSDQGDSPTGEVIQTDTGKSYQPVTVSFSFVATYDNFRSFMQDIEKSLRIVDVESVAFASAPNGLNSYNVSVKTYWLK